MLDDFAGSLHPVALPNAICVCGSWVALTDAVRLSNWETIRVAAHAAGRP
jgi:hypothetical protein